MQFIPADCLRGLRSKDWRNSEGYVVYNAFMPNEKAELLSRRELEGRSPPAFEVSINWIDCPYNALKQLYEDTENSKYGVAQIKIEHLRRVRNHSIGFQFAWERAPVKGKKFNPFHGNLLFLNLEASEKWRRRELAGVIAAALPKPSTRHEVEIELEKRIANPESRIQSMLRKFQSFFRRILCIFQ